MPISVIRKGDKTKLDIIIVNYNSTDCLIECLKSIELGLVGITCHIIVHDNASIDRPDRIQKLFPYVSLILSSKNIGFAKAVNRACRMSHSSLVMLLNPDTLVMKGFFEQIFEFFEAEPDVGIVGPKIIESSGKIQGSARMFPTPLTTLFGRRSPVTKIFPNNSITQKNILTLAHDGKTTIDVEWVSGACMVARRDALSEIDGFDERFFLYWEDTDLCKRIRDRGWRVVYFPKTKIVHLTGQSSSTNLLLSVFHFHRSCYFLFIKHARYPVRLLQPIAFIGLAARAIFTLFLHYTSRIVQKKSLSYRYIDHIIPLNFGKNSKNNMDQHQLGWNREREGRHFKHDGHADSLN